MPKAELVAGRVVVSDVGYRDKDLIREVPGCKYDQPPNWSVPATVPVIKVMRGLFGERLEIGDALHQWVWDVYDTRITPALKFRALAMDPNADELAGDPRLRPFQRLGVDFLWWSRGAVLADDMGAGKTVQAIKTLDLLGAYPALVVAPNSVLGVWRSEFSRWSSGRDVGVVTGGAVARRKTLAEQHDVYVIGWGSLRLHTRVTGYGDIRLTDAEKQRKELNRPWKVVIADEAHRAIHPRSKQTRALWAVGETAEVRYALTGTPIADTPDHFWSLLHFVAPDEWPARTKFIDRYCLTAWNEHGGIDVIGLRPDRQEEFFHLVDPRFLRRPKSLVLPQLPPKVYMERRVEMSAKQLKAYKQIEDECIADVDGGVILAINPLVAAGRLVQFASASASIDDEGEVRLCTPSSKLDELTDLLEEMGDKPLVVFAQSRQLIELTATKLEHDGITHRKLVGGMTALQRTSAVEDFQAGQCRVILCTYGAGAEGITLTRADTLCRMQLSWSLIENKQAEDRIHRIGQEGDSVTIIDFIAPDTIEESMQGAVLGKGERLEEIVRDRQTLRQAVLARRGGL